MASAMTTEPAVVQRDTFTVFQPAVKAYVPSTFHCPPPVCWFLLTVASCVPEAFETTNGVVVERLVPSVHHASTVRVRGGRQVERERRCVADGLRVGEGVAAAVVARGRGGRGPVGRGAVAGDARVVVRVVVVDDDLTAAAVAVDLAQVGRPRPVGAGVGAVVGLEFAVGDEVVDVARDGVGLADVAAQARREVDLPRREGRLRGVAAVLDADGEVVARVAVAPALGVAVERAVVRRPDVVGAVGLTDELRDLGPGLVDDVVGARAGGGRGQVAPAAAVAALAGVDDDHPDLPDAARRTGVVVGRGPPDSTGEVDGGGAGHACEAEERKRDGGARRREGGDDLAARRAHDGALFDGRVDTRLHVLRLPGLLLDAAVAGHDRRPRVEVGAVDAGLGGVAAQEGRGGAQVGGGVGADVGLAHAGEGGAAREAVATEGHDAEGGRHPLELLLARHHLPPGLGVADGLEERDRHVELGRGGGEARVERHLLRRGSGGNLRPDAIVAGGEEKGRRRKCERRGEAIPHGKPLGERGSECAAAGGGRGAGTYGRPIRSSLRAKRRRGYRNAKVA